MVLSPYCWIVYLGKFIIYDCLIYDLVPSKMALKRLYIESIFIVCRRRRTGRDNGMSTISDIHILSSNFACAAMLLLVWLLLIDYYCVLQCAKLSVTPREVFNSKNFSLFILFQQKHGTMLFLFVLIRWSEGSIVRRWQGKMQNYQIWDWLNLIFLLKLANTNDCMV